jgi:formyl-CoA transferase
MNLPLDGVRVVDLTQVMGGPFCTMQLGDLGADVIKVEPPAGDLARSMGGAQLRTTGEDNAPFFALNRNKRSIVLDLTQNRDREVFFALAQTADVLVESFRPGVMKRLGADYETMAARHPRLIYASISGFGQTGPYADRPGFDLIAQGMSGILSVTGEPDGTPVKCGVPIADISAGMFAANGVLAALIARGTTGRGQHVDTSLFESALAMCVWETTEYWATGTAPRAKWSSAHRLEARRTGHSARATDSSRSPRSRKRSGGIYARRSIATRSPTITLRRRTPRGGEPAGPRSRNRRRARYAHNGGVG